MKQGSTFILSVNLDVDMSYVDSIIFTVKNKDVKLTKEDWIFDDGKFKIPFTQEETVQLEGRTLIEAQINFIDKNVAKTKIETIYINPTLDTRIIDGNQASIDGTEINLEVDGEVTYVGGLGGENGATFYPSVSEDGTLSWTNDKGLENPPSVNIKGKDGKSAYQYAKDGGYTGTEVEFAEKLAKEIPTKTSQLINDSNFETTKNKVTIIDENASDEQYPSAKAVSDFAKKALNTLPEHFMTKLSGEEAFERIENIETSYATKEYVDSLMGEILGGAS